MENNLTKDLNLKLSVEALTKLVQDAKAQAAANGRILKNVYVTVRENTPDRQGPSKFDSNKMIQGVQYTQHDTHSAFKKMSDGNFLTIGYGTKLVQEGGMTAPQPAAPMTAQVATAPQPVSPQQAAYPAHPQAVAAPVAVAPAVAAAEVNPFAGAEIQPDDFDF